MPLAFRSDDGLNNQLEELWNASIGSSTRQAYETGLNCFKTFMALNGISCYNGKLPEIDESCLLYFVTYCQKSLYLKHQTIKLYLAGVRYFYIRGRGFDPLKNALRLPIVLRGIKKSQNNVTRERLPITAAILQNLCTLLSSGTFSTFIDLMLLCCFKLAFFGFLRCGEFTCRPNSDSFSTVLIQDIDIDPDNMSYIFLLRSSKNEPFHKGVSIIIYENSDFQPVNTMTRYIELRKNLGARLQSPLFIESEHSCLLLSRDTFIKYLRLLLEKLGYDVGKFSGHSFRIGAATSTAACGVEDHIIQTLGRWSSDCYIRYIRTSNNVIRKAQHKMCSYA